MHGKSGKDLILKVPPGTTVKNQLTDQVVVDMIEPNFEYVICKGGNGGFGNARFKTQTNTAPRIANDGQEGEALKVSLELKVIADVGLVGFPNAGKSTLISSISNARPKISDYPFTTLTPNLGIVKYGDYKSFVMADIPGLIEGAAEGKGLGTQFLRHIERTKVLVFLIDGTIENINEQYQVLRKELDKFNSNLNNRSSLLLITKLDATNKDCIEKQKLPDIDTIKISSVSRLNLDLAIKRISSLLEKSCDE